MEMYNAIKLLADAFEAYGLKYQVNENDQFQEIHVPFGIQNGPLADVRYISVDRGNEVMVRIVSLVNKVPAEKRYKLLDICNALNQKYKFLKFIMDSDNDISVEYDLPTDAGNDCLGQMAVEIFLRTMMVLNEEYPMIARELYAMDRDEPDSQTDSDTKQYLLSRMKKNPDDINITISRIPPSESADK